MNHSHHSLWYSVNFTLSWNTFFYTNGKLFTSVLPFESEACISLSFRDECIMPLGSQTSILKWRGWQGSRQARILALTDCKLYNKSLYRYLNFQSPVITLWTTRFNSKKFWVLRKQCMILRTKSDHFSTQYYFIGFCNRSGGCWICCTMDTWNTYVAGSFWSLYNFMVKNSSWKSNCCF